MSWSPPSPCPTAVGSGTAGPQQGTDASGGWRRRGRTPRTARCRPPGTDLPAPGTRSPSALVKVWWERLSWRAPWKPHGRAGQRPLKASPPFCFGRGGTILSPGCTPGLERRLHARNLQAGGAWSTAMPCITRHSTLLLPRAGGDRGHRCLPAPAPRSAACPRDRQQPGRANIPFRREKSGRWRGSNTPLEPGRERRELRAEPEFSAGSRGCWRVPGHTGWPQRRSPRQWPRESLPWSLLAPSHPPTSTHLLLAPPRAACLYSLTGFAGLLLIR